MGYQKVHIEENGKAKCGQASKGFPLYVSNEADKVTCKACAVGRKNLYENFKRKRLLEAAEKVLH